MQQIGRVEMQCRGPVATAEMPISASKKANDDGPIATNLVGQVFGDGQALLDMLYGRPCL